LRSSERTALYIWFRKHRSGPVMVPAVVLTPQATDLCHGGSFNRQGDLRAFWRRNRSGRFSVCHCGRCFSSHPPPLGGILDRTRIHFNRQGDLRALWRRNPLPWRWIKPFTWASCITRSPRQWLARCTIWPLRGVSLWTLFQWPPSTAGRNSRSHSNTLTWRGMT
jgi:hypothetical protein